MKTLALVVAVAVGLASSPAVAAERAPKQRGFLTGLGLGFLLTGLTGVGVGIAASVNANVAATHGAAYKSTTEAQATTVSLLRTQIETSERIATAAFIIGGALVVGAIICLIIDTPPPVAVTFVPNAHGGTFALSANF